MNARILFFHDTSDNGVHSMDRILEIIEKMKSNKILVIDCDARCWLTEKLSPMITYGDDVFKYLVEYDLNMGYIATIKSHLPDEHAMKVKDNVTLIPGSKELYKYDKFIWKEFGVNEGATGSKHWVDHLKTLCQTLKNHYDYILINSDDTISSFNTVMSKGMEIATSSDDFSCN
jgi:cellulose biosynthesis protein BcsQ